jgi:tetratricopeptide (TPR) repeat protein
LSSFFFRAGHFPSSILARLDLSRFYGARRLRHLAHLLLAAFHDYEKALVSAQDDTTHQAASLAALSVVYSGLGHLKESLRSGREALRLVRDLEDPRAEAYVLTSLAASHSKLGQHSSARSCLQNSLRLRRKIGDERGELVTLRNLAKIYVDLGETSRARAFLEEAAQRNEALKARAVSTAVRKRSASPYTASKKVGDVSGREVEVASARLVEAEERARRIRWLHSYISDERGRKFHFRYEAPSMETMLEDSRRAGLSPAPEAEFMEPTMFS